MSDNSVTEEDVRRARARARALSEAEFRRVARHFPGFEPALLAVLDHVQSADCETTCGLPYAEVAEAG